MIFDFFINTPITRTEEAYLFSDTMGTEYLRYCSFLGVSLFGLRSDIKSWSHINEVLLLEFLR